MENITLCPGNNCPLKIDCKRYRLKSTSDHQSYFKPPYVFEEDKEKATGTVSCDEFLKFDEGDQC